MSNTKMVEQIQTMMATLRTQAEAMEVARSAMLAMDAEIKRLRAAVAVEHACVTENKEAAHTEIVLRDAPTVWVWGGLDHELGYDMATGELIAIRVRGLVAIRARGET